MSEREQWLDSLRGFAIIIMLVGHSSCPGNLNVLIYGFHMPLFFIVSGYLFNYYKYFEGGLKKFLIKKVKRLVMPYFCLCIINIFLYYPVELYNGAAENFWTLFFYHMKWIIYSMPLTEKMPNCTPLWFLLALFVSSVYTFWVLRFNWNVLRCLVFVAAVCIFSRVLTCYDLFYFPWHVDVALMGCLFMLVGYYIRNKGLVDQCNVFYLLLISIISFVAIMLNGKINIGARLYNNELLMLIGSIGLTYVFCVCFKHYISSSKMLEYLGKNTIVIMAFNYFINTYYHALITKYTSIPYFWWETVIVDIIVSVIIIRVFDLLIIRCSVLRYVVGK